MKKSTINILVDKDLKRQFEKFCNDVGMNISTAINIYISAVVREQCIPFKITLDSLNCDEYDLCCYKKAVEEYNKNPKTYTVDELRAELDL